MIRVLAIAPGVSEITRFTANQFRHQMEESLEHLLANGSLALEFAANENLIREHFQRGSWDAIHLLAHADARNSARYASVTLESSDAEPRSVSASHLASLLVQGGAQVIVLQSCDEATSFDYVADCLRDRGVRTVITERWLAGGALQAFLVRLYTALASGNAPDEIADKPAEPRVQEVPETLPEPYVRGGWRDVIEAKRANGQFDVFLCHNVADKLAVKEIGQKLKEAGILPWLDEWEIQPGQRWMPLIEHQIQGIAIAAVFIGAAGIGPWQETELHQILQRVVKQGGTLIPVLLPDVPASFQLPGFLVGMTVVDFRSTRTDPVERLIWGITGKRPHEG